MQQCVGMKVLARRGDTFKEGRLSTVRNDGQVHNKNNFTLKLIIVYNQLVIISFKLNWLIYFFILLNIERKFITILLLTVLKFYKLKYILVIWS